MVFSQGIEVKDTAIDPVLLVEILDFLLHLQLQNEKNVKILSRGTQFTVADTLYHKL